ncbi:MAG: DNA mismatch repair protein, partial [Ekhidna sp.]
FLIEGDLNFDNGDEFVQHDHPYSYDLDFFGDRSLFQTLNRTGTVTGKRKLAETLQSIKSPEHIIESQEAVREMAPQVEWRQHLLALARLNPDTNESYSDLMKWAGKQRTKISGLMNIVSFLSPVLMLVGLGLYFLYSNELAGRLSLLLGLINLGVVASQIASIKSELITSTKIEHLLRQYSFLLKEIEKHSFQSTQLKNLQNRLQSTHRKASTSIHELSLLFGRLEHVQNIFAGPILNGLFTYHLHVLRSLAKWRRLYATHIEDWLDVIGEFEQLNSLANFSHNNSDFVFPYINSEQHIQFEDLGHPLIAKEKSVTNSIDFDNQKFFILTGSNMSGKSTFLRTLGVNMVLGGIGAPVYASKANVH